MASAEAPPPQPRSIRRKAGLRAVAAALQPCGGEPLRVEGARGAVGGGGEPISVASKQASDGGGGVGVGWVGGGSGWRADGITRTPARVWRGRGEASPACGQPRSAARVRLPSRAGAGAGRGRRSTQGRAGERTSPGGTGQPGVRGGSVSRARRRRWWRAPAARSAAIALATAMPQRPSWWSGSTRSGAAGGVGVAQGRVRASAGEPDGWSCRPRLRTEFGLHLAGVAGVATARCRSRVAAPGGARTAYRSARTERVVPRWRAHRGWLRHGSRGGSPARGGRAAKRAPRPARLQRNSVGAARRAVDGAWRRRWW